MKVNFTKCDICGKEIKDAHPLRMLVQEYQSIERQKSYTSGTYTQKAYKTIKQYDICEDCEEKVQEKLKGGE